MSARKTVSIGSFTVGRNGRGETLVAFRFTDPRTGNSDELIRRPLSRMVAEARLILKDMETGVQNPNEKAYCAA